MVAGRWRESQLRERESVGPGATESAGGHGGPIEIESDNGALLVDDAEVIEADH